ncbi:MAG: hypothetical protein GQ581_04230 [Methyloprofundus sp.]|nr:hypothetical protein [Methyloprofundus sp.]
MNEFELIKNNEEYRLKKFDLMEKLINIPLEKRIIILLLDAYEQYEKSKISIWRTG